MVIPIGTTVTDTKLGQRNQGEFRPNDVASGRSRTYQSATPVSATSETIERSHSRRSGRAERRGVIRYQCPSTIEITDVPSATAEVAAISAVNVDPSEGLGRANAASAIP